jgi:hypothetical protein
MSQLPPFTVIAFKQTDLLDDTGDDIVFFHVDLEVNEQLYHCIVPFFKLSDHLAENKTAHADYFNRLRSSINGFGPKETVVLRLARQEGYDVEQAVTGFIAAEMTLEKLIPVNKKQTSGETAGFKQKFDEMQAQAQEGKSFNLRDIAFKDELIDLLNKKVLEIYPEILNSRPEYITELKTLLVDNVLRFGEGVNSLARKAYRHP